MQKFLQAIGPFHTTTMMVLAALGAMLLIATPVKSQPVFDCIATERAQGATFGTAEFFGSTWRHKWENGSEMEVPAEGLRLEFQEMTILYGAERSGGDADNLTTLYRSLGDGQLTAVRLRDGSTFVINDECKESWALIRNDPTTPVATDGTIVVEPELECLSQDGILTFESISVDEKGFRLDDPIRQTGGWAMSFGPGEYVVGIDT